MTTGIAIKRIDGYEPALKELTRRGSYVEPELSASAKDGIKRVFGQTLTAREVVDRIIADVRQDGDTAVKRYTEAFDGEARESFEVNRDEWQSARDSLPGELVSALETAATRIREFHDHEPDHSWFEHTQHGTFGQMIRPLERVGIYAPGGTAAYASSLLMTAIPASVAGVDDIVVAAPPGRDGTIAPTILAAAHIANVDRVFAIGGAQAIAAMAYGTESIPHVDKICGPGNIFVVLAKQAVFGVVDLDQLPGPTETLLVADDSADIELVAADMIAQAEHDAMATSILVTTSRKLADALPAVIEGQAAELEREEIVQNSLSTTGRIIHVDRLSDAVALANAYAPEHLCLLVQHPWELLPEIRHAAGVFIGENSSEVLGDYTAGPSHVMPTGGTARHSSPIHVREFQKVISLIGANARAIEDLGEDTMTLANAEGLTGHAAAIRRRLRRSNR